MLTAQRHLQIKAIEQWAADATPILLTAVLTVSAGSSRRRHQPSSSSSSSWEVGAAFAAEGFPGAEPEPEPEGGEGEAWQESTLMPLRRTIQVREPPCCVAIGSVRLLT